MIGLGILAAADRCLDPVGHPPGRTPHRPADRAGLAMALPFMPLFANSFGWIFTEMGRQPWAVFGLMTTDRAVSPGVSAGEVLTSLIVLTAALRRARRDRGAAAADLHRPGRRPVARPATRTSTEPGDDRPLAFAY